MMMRSFALKTTLLLVWLSQLANAQETYKKYDMILEYPNGIGTCETADIAGVESVVRATFESLTGQNGLDHFGFVSNDVCDVNDDEITFWTNGVVDANANVLDELTELTVEHTDVCGRRLSSPAQSQRRKLVQCCTVCDCCLWCVKSMNLPCDCRDGCGRRDRELFSIWGHFSKIAETSLNPSVNPCGSANECDLHKWAAEFLNKYRTTSKASTFVENIGLMDHEIILHVCDRQYKLEVGSPRAVASESHLSQ